MRIEVYEQNMVNPLASIVIEMTEPGEKGDDMCLSIEGRGTRSSHEVLDMKPSV